MVEKTVDSHSLYKEAMYLFVYLLLPVLTVQVLTWPSPSFLYAREIPGDLSSDTSELNVGHDASTVPSHFNM